MTAETKTLIFHQVRDTLREVAGPIFEAAESMTDWPGGQAEALREISSASSPETHGKSLHRLGEKLEQLIDGKVSRSVTKVLEPDIKAFVSSLHELKASSTANAEFLEPYAGFRGSVRLALETGTRPWDIVASFAGKGTYQIRREELGNQQLSAFESFGDRLQALILALESALSQHTGQEFSFRETHKASSPTDQPA